MIYLGDLFNVIPTLAAESIDACVTDPPYGIGVMGKEWDTFKPEDLAKQTANHQPIDHKLQNERSASMHAGTYSKTLTAQREFQAWSERWAYEVFRVLKPGGYILVCGAPRSFHRMTSGIEDAGFVVRDCFSWLYGSGFPKSLNINGGRGTALKPAWEPIILARKPMIDTLEVNAHIFGTGALNIDACRVPMTTEGAEFIKKACRPNTAGQEHIGNVMNRPLCPTVNVHEDGRWPPNVLLDDESALMLDTQTGALKASRFMYIAKPGASERDEGCSDLEPRLPTELTGRKEGSAGLKHARAGTDRKASNFHPTVKPVMLMQWLVTLVTPPDGIVLDPFMGSGTTGMAARLADRKFIGIEREAEYVEIARRRISKTQALFFGEEEVIK